MDTQGEVGSEGTPVQETAAQPSEWEKSIAQFAAAVKLSPEQLTEVLRPLVGEPGPDAIELLMNSEDVTVDEVVAAVKAVAPNIGTGKIKQQVRKLRGAAAPAAPEAAKPVTVSFDILPQVKSDEAWLAALKATGVLKVDETTVETGMRGALASRMGFFELPEILVNMMEKYADKIHEPVGKDFFKLRKLLTRRNYAEIFAALEDVDGAFVSKQRKKNLIKRLDAILLPAITGFHEALKAWAESWQQNFANPGAFMMMMVAGQARPGQMPPGMLEPPPTDVLKDAAEGVINEINRCFSGMGIPVAMAVAYDAKCIREVLANPTLPLQIGAPNSEMMLKMLEVEVGADYPRLEQNVCRYALSIMEAPKITAGADLGYFGTMLVLGSQIPWDKLKTPARRLSGSGRQEEEEEEEER